MEYYRLEEENAAICCAHITRVMRSSKNQSARDTLPFCEISGSHGGDYEYGSLCRVIWQKFTDVSEVLGASMSVLMMEAASTSETSVNVYMFVI
jgi:hypothetical protein